MYFFKLDLSYISDKNYNSFVSVGFVLFSMAKR